MEQSTTWKTEDLLQHHGWARSLARHLVADEATADDVVQESMMRALERAPGGIEDARMQRSWLGTVVRNVVRQRGRAEGRRSHREREAAPEEALPSALDMTTFAEGQKLLLGALLTLDEDSRHLVLLRYHEGLSSAEIARRSDRNAGTIRSKIKRALDQLREELDRKYGGDRSAWHAAVAPLAVFAQPRSGALAAGASHGLPVGVKWAAALAFVSFAAFSLFQLVTPGSYFDRRAEPPTLTPDEVAARLGTHASGATAEGRGALVAVPEADGSDARVAIADGTESGEPLTSEVAATKKGTFRVRLVDEQGRPIQGVEVSARSSETVKSDADGRAEIEVFLGRPTDNASVNFRHFGHASDQGQFEGVRGETVDVGDVALRAGGDILGRVVDRDGAPVPDLSVSTEGLWRRTGSGRGMVSTTSTMIGRTGDTTDEEGRFHLRGVLAGEVDVEVRSDDKIWTGDARSVRVGAGEVVKGLVVTVDEVPRETRIEGVVLDHEGAPVPYASLNLSWSVFFSNSSSSRSADRKGRFVVIVPAGVDVQMSFAAPGGNIPGAVRRDVKGGTLDMVVQLAAPRSFRVLVTGLDSEPVEGASVGLTLERSWGPLEETDSNGLAELPRPLDGFTLAVRAEGYADFDEDYSALPEGEPATVTLPVELEPIPQVVGRVQANGGAVEGASLSVRRVARNRVEIAGLPSLVHDHVEATGSSDERGAFALTLQEGGSYVLRAESSGLAPAEYGPFDYDPTEGLDGVELMLTTGGSVRGRVMDGDGLRQKHVVLLSRGDGVVRTVRTDLDGDYHFDHVTPGPCFLRVVPEMILSGVGSSNSTLGLPYRTIQGDVVVVEGGSTLLDLMTGRAQPRVMLRGEVRLQGQDATRWVALLQPDEGGLDGGGLIEKVRLAPDGSFEAAGGAPGRYALLLTDAKRDDDEHAIRMAVPLDLSAGINEWKLNLAIGDVRTGPLADRESETLLWRGPAGAFAIASLAQEGQSRAFLAGEVCRVPTPQILRPDALAKLDQLDPLETVQLTAGGVVLVGD